MVTYEYQRRADFLHIHMRCAGKCRQVTRMECPIESSQCLNSGAVQLRLQTLQPVYYLALKPATREAAVERGLPKQLPPSPVRAFEAKIASVTMCEAAFQVSWTSMAAGATSSA